MESPQWNSYSQTAAFSSPVHREASGRPQALAFAGKACEVHLLGRSVPDVEATAEQLREISGRPVHVHAGDMV